MAIQKISTGTLGNDSVTAAQIAPGTIVDSDIADAAVTSAKLGTASVISAKVASDAISAVKIQDNAVTTTKIINDAVTTTKITNANVTTAKIADDAVTLAKMAPGVDGNLISYDASQNPVAVVTGTAGQVLTSAGAGAPPTFQTIASSPTTLKINRTITGGSVVNNRAVSTADDGSVGVLPTVNSLGTKVDRGTESSLSDYGTGLTKVRITFSSFSGTTSTMNIFGSYVNGSGLWVENSTPLTSTLDCISGVAADAQGQTTWTEVGSQNFHIQQYVHTNQVSNNNIVQQVFAVVVNTSTGAPTVVGSKVVNERSNGAAAGRQVGIRIFGPRHVMGRILISSISFPAYYFNGSTWTEASDDVGQTVYDQGLEMVTSGNNGFKIGTMVNAANNRLMQAGNNQIRALTTSSNAPAAGVTNVTLSSDFADGRTFFLDNTHILQCYRDTAGLHKFKTFSLAADGNSVSLISTFNDTNATLQIFLCLVMKGTDFKKLTVFTSNGRLSNMELDSSYNILGFQLSYTSFGVQSVRYISGDTFRVIGALSANPHYSAVWTISAYRTTAFRYVGVSTTTASSGTAQIATEGLISGFSGLSIKSNVFAALDGVLSQTSSGAIVTVGNAISPTEVYLYGNAI